MTLPQGALYETLPFEYKTTPDESQDADSPTYHLHNARTPAHRYFEIACSRRACHPTCVPKPLLPTAATGWPAVNCGGAWRGDMLVTKVRTFGDYCVMTDNTQPPRISPVVYSADMRRKNTLSFRIRDNFSTGGSADDMSYRAR